MSNISKIKVGNTTYDIEDTVARNSGGGLSADVKQALLNCFQKVAYIDANGQTYYDALESALYPPANLSSISAVYTQSGTVYDGDSLDSLKSDLVVTAIWSDSSTSTVASTDYALSGTLTVGTSTITVSYGGKTTTFTVTVTSSPCIADGLVHYWDAIDNTGNGHDNTATTWKDLVGSCDLTKGDVTTSSWESNALTFEPSSTGTAQAWMNTSGITDSTNMTIEIVVSPNQVGFNSGAGMILSAVSYSNNANKRIGIVNSDVSALVFSADSSGGYLTGLTNVNEIHSIVGTYTSSTSSSGCWVNGQEKTTRASHTFNSAITGIALGGFIAGTNKYPYKGKVHAIRIYNRVLTAEEIYTNYQKSITYYGLE